MTKVKFKKAMLEAMTKYKIDVDMAEKLARNNHPEYFMVIAEAKMQIIQDEMFK